ncbi:MAG: hypothetical protein IJS32_03180 [Kiritimatiellae bacterium]|nr:hypothetical protein [Kiritimatiellia bacterium]
MSEGLIEKEDVQHLKSQLLSLAHFKSELGFIGYLYGASGADMFRHIAKAVDEIDWIRLKLEGMLPKDRREKRAAPRGAASSRAASPRSRPSRSSRKPAPPGAPPAPPSTFQPFNPSTFQPFNPSTFQP